MAISKGQTPTIFWQISVFGGKTADCPKSATTIAAAVVAAAAAAAVAASACPKVRSMSGKERMMGNGKGMEMKEEEMKEGEMKENEMKERLQRFGDCLLVRQRRDCGGELSPNSGDGARFRFRFRFRFRLRK